MKKIITTILCSTLFFFQGNSQIVRKTLFEMVQNNLEKEGVEEVYVSELYDLLSKEKEVILLDSRTIEEYSVSHLKDAIWVGYENFDLEKVANIEKDKKIVVYCSVGARSGDITKKLNQNGFKSVFNLRGGLFEWSNNQFPMFNENKIKTEDIHPYDFFWGSFIINGNKVYE